MPGINEIREEFQSVFQVIVNDLLMVTAGCKLVVLNYHARIKSEMEALL